MPIYKLNTKIDDQIISYNLDISCDNLNVIKIEVQEQEHMNRLIVRLNAYKRVTEPSEEDITGNGKQVSYQYLSLENVEKKTDNFSLIILKEENTVDIRKDIIDALKFTHTLSQETYNKICQDCNINQSLESSSNISTHPSATFSSSLSRINQILEIQAPTPNDLIDFLRLQRPDLCNPDLLRAAADMLVMSQNFVK